MTDRNRKWLHLILTLGLLARVVAWWFQGGFHYPDEIFQQVEPAYYLRTGVAWLPWEFVRGLRSWVLPGIYAALLEILSWVGITGLPAVRAITLHNALLTVVMIPAGFRIGVALWPKGDSEAERAGLCVALFTALMPTLVYYTPHTLIGIPCMVALTWGYVHWLEARVRVPADSQSLIWCGLWFGIAGALRLACGFHMLIPLVDLIFRGRLRAIRLLLVGAMFPVLFVGVLDLMTWGSFFHSTIEHVRYNFFEGGASKHGVSPWTYYLAESLWGRLGPLAPIASLVMLSGLRYSWVAALTLVVPVAVLSGLPHKEDRFVIYNWPLLSALLGIGCAVIIRWLRQHGARHWRVSIGATVAVILISNLKGTMDLPWTERRDMFRAQALVGQQSDATGLLLDDRRHMNGGYAVFNKNAPQAPFERGLVSNPVFNYAALRAGGSDAQRLARMGWTNWARFDEIVVLRRPPTLPTKR